MIDINGLKINDESFYSLLDETRKGISVTYFCGVVAELSLAETVVEVYTIWQSARNHLQNVYAVSTYAEEDFFVLDMELGRCIRRKAKKMSVTEDGLCCRSNLDETAENDLANLYDQTRKEKVRDCFVFAQSRFLIAQSAEELSLIYEKYLKIMVSIYDQSEFSDRDLPVCRLSFANFFREAVTAFLKRQL